MYRKYKNIENIEKYKNIEMYRKYKFFLFQRYFYNIYIYKIELSL